MRMIRFHVPTSFMQVPYISISILLPQPPEPQLSHSQYSSRMLQIKVATASLPAYNTFQYPAQSASKLYQRYASHFDGL